MSDVLCVSRNCTVLLNIYFIEVPSVRLTRKILSDNHGV